MNESRNLFPDHEVQFLLSNKCYNLRALIKRQNHLSHCRTKHFLEMKKAYFSIAWESSQHFCDSITGFPNEVWGTSAEISFILADHASLPRSGYCFWLVEAKFSTKQSQWWHCKVFGSVFSQANLGSFCSKIYLWCTALFPWSDPLLLSCSRSRGWVGKEPGDKVALQYTLVRLSSITN